MTPNPGSREAVAQGCICPVLDNWRGNPEIGRIRGFIMVVGCPLHHLSEKEDAMGAGPSSCPCGWRGIPSAGCCPSCRAPVAPGEAQSIADERGQA